MCGCMGRKSLPGAIYRSIEHRFAVLITHNLVKSCPGFVVGFGLMKQKGCLTNGIGPEIYKECADVTTYKYKGN